MAYTTIDDPSAYFTITLYTGDGSNGRAITNSANAGDFQPDWLWYKERSSTSEHRAFDSSRGNSKRIEPNNTNAEATDTTNHQSFDSNGFTIGNSGSTNANGDTYVAWQWKANGGSRTTFSSSGNQLAGGYQANTTAGFSIVDYTGNATNGATFPHGLGATPTIAIIKDRTNAGDGGGTNWIVAYTIQDGTSDRLYLNGNNAKYDLSGTEFRADFDSNNVTLGTWNNVNASGTHIAYVFTPIQGYSKFDSYTGNGNADGPFVYIGFKPAWLISKRTDASDNWRIVDLARNPTNDSSANALQSNNANNETDSGTRNLDLLSNGFKVRTTDPDSNANGGTYIYMAFAESPFVSSEGVPTTAQ